MTFLRSPVLHAQQPCVQRPEARPFMKWAGGKRQLVSEIAALMPGEIQHYWEPFVGGGAVFFALSGRLDGEAYLSDLNTELIIAYNALKRDANKVILLLEEHRSSHSPEYYREVRSQYGLTDAFASAARTIYLNKTCFNGLYRVNKAGRFNVPIGRHRHLKICDADNLRAVGRVLQRATVRRHSFADINPQAGDVVYCDPPYDETFASYTSPVFDAASQRELRDCAACWRENGVAVILSNSDTRLIRSLFADWRLKSVNGVRNINSNGAGRGKVSELLIY